MAECKIYRFDRQGFFEAEDVTYSDKDVDFARDFRAPDWHTWTPPPKYDPATEIPQYVKGEWRIVLLKDLLPPEPTLDELKAQKLAELAQARWEQETGGLTLPDGTVIKTDRESQGLLTAAAVMAKFDPTMTVEWKAATGWIDLDATTVIQFAGAVREHVQKAFSKERDLAEQVAIAGSVQEVQSVEW